MRYYVRTRCFGATHKFIARKRNDLATRGEESGMAITIRHQREEKERERERESFIQRVEPPSSSSPSSWREIRTTAARRN